MKHNKTLAAAVAASFAAAATGAEAATYAATLLSVKDHRGGAVPTPVNITSSTATWSYDDSTGLLTQTGGTLNLRFGSSPVNTLFRHSITGLVIGGSSAATATSFVCTEGNIGTGLNASLCGNYNFGANYTNESTVSWGPGTATARTIGGDDGAGGPQQSIAAYNYFATLSWVGTTLTLRNASCNPFAPNGANNCSYGGGFNDGYTWELDAGPQTAVPIPPAAWLFGSALGVMGWMRRRTR